MEIVLHRRLYHFPALFSLCENACVPGTWNPGVAGRRYTFESWPNVAKHRMGQLRRCQSQAVKRACPVRATCPCKDMHQVTAMYSAVGTKGIVPERRVRKQLVATSSRAMLFVAALVAVISAAAGQENRILLLETSIPLPNVKGRIDNLSVDVKGQRLFVAAVENTRLRYWT